MSAMGSERWNSNLHAFDKLLELVPADAMRGLDVGCGEGETARRLRRRVPSVIGLDTDVASIECARSLGGDIEYIVGDLFAGAVEESSFDVVTAVAVLHHVDHRKALGQLSRLVRPATTDVLDAGLPFAYVRGGTHLVAINPRRDAVTLATDRLIGATQLVGSDGEFDGRVIEHNELRLNGFGYTILELP